MKHTKTRLMALTLGLTAMVGGLGLSACTGGEEASSTPTTSEAPAIEKKVEIVGQASIIEGQAVRYGFKFEGVSAGENVTWSSSDNAIFTVDQTGEVTGVSAGKATLTASVDGASGTMDINVVERETQTFSVRFVNYDGTLLYLTKVAYGEKAAYVGENPERTANYQTVYVFTGWDKDPAETTITEGTVFTAQYGRSDGSGFVFNKISAREYQLTGYAGKGGETMGSITVPSSYAGLPVTTIGSYAFQQAEMVLQVTIPEGITSIGDRAFYNCPELIRVNLPESLYDFGAGMFEGCAKLETVNLPSSLDKIPENTFNGCTALKTVAIPSKVNTICANAFKGCSTIDGITLPDAVVSIESEAFKGCTSLKTINIPDGVTSIATMDESVKSVFEGCSSLETVTGMKNVKTVGHWGFKDCSSLKDITISMADLEGIGERGFQGTAFTEITLADDMAIYKSGQTNGLDQYAFANCYNLATVNYGKNMETTPTDLFYGCYSLNENGLKNMTGLTSLGTGTFEYCGFVNVDFGALFPNVTSIPSNLFVGNMNHSLYDEEGVIIEEGPDRAPYASMKTLIIPNTVTSLGSGCFSDNYALESVTFEADNTATISLGSGCFEYCYKLKTVNFNGNAASNYSTSRFVGCYSLEAFDLPSNVTNLVAGDDGVLYNAGKTILYSYPTGKAGTSFEIPSTVTTVNTTTGPVGGFRGAQKLESITIPESVTRVSGTYAFAECTSLKSITFPSSITSLGGNTCEGNTALETATFETTGLTSLPSSAFKGCTSLKTVKLGVGQTSISAAFADLVADPEDETQKVALTDVYIYPSETRTTPSVSGGAFCAKTTLTSSNALEKTSSAFSNLTIHWGGTKANWKKGVATSSGSSSAFESGAKVVCSDGTLILDSITIARVRQGYGYAYRATYTWAEEATTPDTGA